MSFQMSRNESLIIRGYPSTTQTEKNPHREKTPRGFVLQKVSFALPCLVVFAYPFAMPRRKKDPTMASKQNPPEKEVSPAAFLNGAKRYGEAADLLLSLSGTAGISLDPIYMLYFHAAELALKAFLVFKGVKTKDLKSRSWGHNLEKMYKEALGLGLAPEAAHSMDIHNVMELLHSGNRQEAFRYFTWEPRFIPEVAWAGKVVNLLIGLVEYRIDYTKGKPGGAVTFNVVIGRPSPKTTP